LDIKSRAQNQLSPKEVIWIYYISWFNDTRVKTELKHWKCLIQWIKDECLGI
jgi:hypothetical protein